MRLIIGIDPGLDGGVAILPIDGSGPRVYPMPTMPGKRRTVDARGLSLLLREAKGAELVAVEDVHSHPKQGVASTFAFGRAFGEVLGVVGALELPLELVTPQRWKKSILEGTAKDKHAAIRYASKRFPSASLLASPRSRVNHDGMADALCLAEFGRRLIVGED